MRKSIVGNILTIIGVTLLVTLPFQLHHSFGDGDIFFHIKISQLIAKSGFVTNFTWLPFTSLGEYFADHHLLYHILLIPFIKIFNPFVGAKIFHLISIIGLMLMMYFLLRSLLPHYIKKYSVLFFALAPLSSVLFISRVGIQKAAPLAVGYSLLYTYLVVQERFFWIGVAAAVYVYLYGGWPLLLVISCVYGGVLIVKEKAYRRALLGMCAACNGVLIGLVINPYFPRNIYFYWQQIYQIALRNDFIGSMLATEWLPYDHLGVFFAYSTVPTLLLVLGFVLVIIFFHKLDTKALFFGVLSFLLFLLTARSRRFIEYLVPFGTVFGGYLMMMSYFWSQHTWPDLLKNFLRSSLLQVVAISVMIIVAFSLRWELLTQPLYQDYFGYTIYENSMRWAREHIPAGEVIYHTRWEEFPMLFYYNDQNRYISGLDPRFLVYENADLATEYYASETYESPTRLRQAMNACAASYLLINHHSEKDTPVLPLLQHSELFTQVYHDDFIDIYKL